VYEILLMELKNISDPQTFQMYATYYPKGTLKNIRFPNSNKDKQPFNYNLPYHYEYEFTLLQPGLQSFSFISSSVQQKAQTGKGSCFLAPYLLIKICIHSFIHSICTYSVPNTCQSTSSQ
jgi:hypothetical protein